MLTPRIVVFKDFSEEITLNVEILNNIFIFFLKGKGRNKMNYACV